MAITSYDVTAYEKKNASKHDAKSPYLTSDRIQLLSRVTEKKIVHKKTLDYLSSFPLAANLYKANSGDVTAPRRVKKKNKKSVLTLTNERTPGSQKCTVSDINDSEYFSTTGSCMPRLKKRTSIKNVRKPRTKKTDYEFRDNRYCSQIDINLNNGSANVLGDYQRISSNIARNKRKPICHPETKEHSHGGVAPHNVWSMLRNMNRFQFVTSPPMSEESEVVLKKKKKKNKIAKKKFNRKDTHTSVIETAEFAYISSYSVGESSQTLSEASSTDRVTVINKRDEFSKICKAFEQRFLKPNYQNNSDNNKSNNNIKAKNNVHKTKKGNIKAVYNDDSKELAESASQQDSDLCSLTEKKENSVQSIRNTDTALVKKCSRDNQIVPLFYSSVGNKKETDKLDPNSLNMLYSGSEHGDEKNDNFLKGKTTLQVPMTSRLPQLKETISKAIFRKGNKDTTNNIIFKSNDQEKRPSLVTAMPRACTMPKFTKNDLKRRLAALHFPIVVLGKEQVRSPLFSESIFDHFSGMDQHIWPFMMGWYDVKPLEKEKPIGNQDKRPRRLAGNNKKADPIISDRRLRKNNELKLKSNLKIRKPVQTEDQIDKNKSEFKRSASIVRPVEHVEVLHSKKQRPMAQIRDKMLTLFQKLEKNIDFNNENEQRCTIVERRSNTIKPNKPNLVTLKPKTPVNTEALKDKIYNRSGFGYPWAKAKCASDFIENVIKKLKNGVYYSQDKFSSIVADTIIPTKNIPEQELCTRDISPKVTITKKQQERPRSIPGFDSSPPVFEIKTLNKNQISVKHRMSNVLMQFDVSVLVQAKQIFMAHKTPISLIPVYGIGDQTKTFKCDTKIINAMLPAELCSILPKMLNQFNFAVSQIDKPDDTFPRPIESSLSTIPEMVQLTSLIHHSLSVFDFLSPVIKQLLTGVFSIVKNKVTAKPINPSIGYDFWMFEMLPNIFFDCTDIIDNKINTFTPRFSNVAKKEITVSNEIKPVLPVAAEENRFYTSALQLYTDVKRSLISSFNLSGLAAILNNILKTKIVGTNECIENMNIMGIKYDGRLLDIKMKIFDSHGNSLGLSNLKIDTQLCNNDQDNFIIHNDCKYNSIKSIEPIRNPVSTDLENKIGRPKTGAKFTIKKRMRFHRLYRKCKAITDVPPPETNTSINKIETLADILEIIGTQRALTSIFDDYSERKILTSIKQMQNWITDINAAQALLVLLLTNKKETSNLVRYRPIILQGIAVNRITKASELDMEIEVIERENLNKIFPQYEGISYLPDSNENHNDLMEELYWIAKTTASDYQKPFDESSEKLLKLLLERRKKLNPSYLRVMARYVGLGLVKSPAKK